MLRASGILLHPTSLPGPFGIGDLGPAAYHFIDALASAGQQFWQMLPLGPTGYGDSPYQTFSAFAGNPLLISPEGLVADGYLPADALATSPTFPDQRVDYGAVIPYKRALVESSYTFFKETAALPRQAALEEFVAEQSAWLDDFALFMALKDAHGGRPWTAWERDLVRRDPVALEEWRLRLRPGIALHTYAQFLFFTQWQRLRAHALERGVRLIGDIPIFVAHDSADCWAHRDLFHLDEWGAPQLVAGVPPDYFSATGQLWGNPLYRWEAMATDGYAWWIARLRHTLALVDLLRVDHFRGFAGYWAIPGDAPTAEYGEWRTGPGIDFFDTVRQALGDLPLIAEDLGVITPDVTALRDRYALPGMRVLQFAFAGDARNHDLPHNYVPRCIVYTGTHDNDTTAGWLATIPPEEREHVRLYTGGSDDGDGVQALIRLAYASIAETAIVPMQDLLGLGAEARMNFPGHPSGNWTWRLPPGALTPALQETLHTLATLYRRTPSGDERE